MERAGADSVPRKSPEVNLEKFKLEGDGECEMIHVYFDQHPLVILEDTSNKPAFSLAGWGQKFPPATGMIRGNVLIAFFSRRYKRLSYMRVGQNGVLYDTASLPNLIPHNHTDDRAPTEGAAIGLLAKISAAYESASELRRDPLKGSRTEISYHWTESQSGISRVRVEAPVNSAPPATAGRVEPVEESTFQGSIPETVADPGDDSDDAGGDAGSDAGIEWFDALDKLPANKSSNPKEITRGSEPHEPPIENQEPHTEPIAVEAGQSDDSTADRSREQEAPVDAESPPDIIPDLIDTIQEQLADATSNSLLETQIASQTSNPPPIVQLPAPKKKKAWFRRWL
ncbi:hypothetical protein FRC09_015782 [Ceratobasidium sp. 395]|nr:hypothetical protein FRC09_015782 [Ceratobasidium sp. 395]